MEKIFITEDSGVAKRIFSILLKPLKMELVFFSSIEEMSKAICGATDVKMIVTDLNFPVNGDGSGVSLGGLVLMSWLRKNAPVLPEELKTMAVVTDLFRKSPPADMPVFMFSSCSDENLVRQIKDLKPSAYFEKSRYFNMESQGFLVKTMREVMEKTGVPV